MDWFLIEILQLEGVEDEDALQAWGSTLTRREAGSWLQDSAREGLRALKGVEVICMHAQPVELCWIGRALEASMLWRVELQDGRGDWRGSTA